MTKLLRFVILRLGPIFLLIYFSKAQSTQVAKQIKTLSNYVTVFQEHTEMSQISRLLRSYVQKLNRPPSDLGRFLDTEYTTKRDMSLDVWEQPFRFEHDGRTWYLVSCGPDLRCRTDDDIRQKIN